MQSTVWFTVSACWAPGFQAYTGLQFLTIIVIVIMIIVIIIIIVIVILVVIIVFVGGREGGFDFDFGGRVALHRTSPFPAPLQRPQPEFRCTEFLG